MCRPAESLFIATHHLPYGCAVSLPATTRCPVLKCAGTLSSTTLVRSFFSASVHGGNFHFTMQESMNIEVEALPLPSYWVCNGPRPTGTSPSTTSLYSRTGTPRTSPP